MASLIALKQSVVALSILGLVLLSILFCTLKLFKTHARHSLFLNFLASWLMYSAYTTFQALTTLALPLTAQTDTNVFLLRGTLLDFFSLVSVVATLNLVIHLWFKMRSALTSKLADDALEGWLTPVLLISPYLTGLLCLAKLFSVWSDNVFAYIFLTVMLIASLWDVLLLAMFLFHHRVVRLAVQRNLLPLSLLLRLLIFSLFRLVYCGVSIGIQTIPADTSIKHNPAGVLNSKLEQAELIIQSLIPISIFALFGLRRDTIGIWFHCFNASPKRTKLVATLSSENMTAHDILNISSTTLDLESRTHLTEDL